MSKKSLVKKPLSAYQSYIASRKKELYSLIGLDPSEIRDLANEEWNLMNDEEKKPFLELCKSEKSYFDSIKDQVFEVGIDSFMSEIKAARKQKNIQEEFREDDILSIINHKKKWKKTWSKKKKESLRIKKTISPMQAKKMVKLKLN